jgi:hypothetical protein
MDKRYQVFISSTFRDLVEERQAVLKAVLELDHMPAGMELFPAADDTAWQLIKDVIDASDYYVLIVGGRYGSMDEEGLGFTEKEYDHALASRKPVVPLLHLSPDNLPRDKTETDTGAWKKLKRFREKVEKRHTCVYWTGVDDLKAKVIVGLTSTVKRYPAIGWVRADQVPSDATLKDMLSLRRRVTELEVQVEAARTAPPQGTEDFVQGDDTVEVEYGFIAREELKAYPHHRDHRYSSTIEPTWNEVFGAVAPLMINEASEPELRSAFKGHLEKRARASLEKVKDVKGMALRHFAFPDDQIDTFLIQFRALGLIKESVKQRSVKDTRTYWSLTPYGDTLMVQLRAVRRTSRPGVEETVNLREAPAEQATGDGAA